MYELAFGANGERFEPPASAAFWRVRRLRPGGRGVPEVVFAESGLPLVVPIESGIDEFRDAVDHAPGKYRLDPIDEAHDVCEGASAAYICINERKAKPVAAHSKEERRGGGSDQLVLELVRANAEMVRTMTDRFAGVMESAATLLRAADGAGLPRRKPLPAPIQMAQAFRNAEPTPVEDDEDETESGAQLANVLQTVAEKAMPLLSHTINTKLLGLTPEQSIALMGGAVAPPSPAPARAPRAKEPERAAGPAQVDFMSHLMAIEALLTPEEAKLARHAIGQMAPGPLAAWRERILAMTPEEAATAVQGEVARLTRADEQDDEGERNTQREAA